jgi:D-serine deaminase-like pyridoxal phosphate-dependent protein
MQITDFFSLEPLGAHLDDLETPVPVIDLDVVERNATRWQVHCEEAGFGNRPHIKTHKLVPLARYQLALGARGITVQKLGEAEVMADAGIRDMLLTFNVVGAAKLARLARLMRRSEICVVADNATVVEGLAHAAAQAGRSLDVLVEIDTGARRNGVTGAAAALDLARLIEATPGLAFAGLMTYPKAGLRREMGDMLKETIDLTRRSGLDCRIVSTGGSPDMWRLDGLGSITEYRAGTYIYFDRSLVARGTCRLEDCALTVLATVVSVPTAERALLDAGSKALTSDLLGLKGYGSVPALDDAPLYDLSEEHGFLDIGAVARKPRVGDRLRILPNHACPVTNLYDRVVIARGDKVLGAARVDARGTVT